jgi:hypothetical protein
MLAVDRGKQVKGAMAYINYGRLLTSIFIMSHNERTTFLSEVALVVEWWKVRLVSAESIFAYLVANRILASNG